MQITNEMIEAGYIASAKVYRNEISKKEAIEHLTTELKWADGSASACISNFKKMLDGELYTFTNNTYQTDYFLTNILIDFGVTGLANAIQAANKHLDYQATQKHNKLISHRKVISQHEKILSNLLKIDSPSVFPDELNATENLFEGVKKSILVNAYERNSIARQKCIENYGAKCAIPNCGFDFEKAYGEIGKGFIHVHHLTQLSNIGQGYEVDPIKDLRPVCPNCHAMLHQKNPPYTIDEINHKLQVIKNL